MPSLWRILARKNMTQTRAPPAAAQGPWSAPQAFAQTSALQNQALVAIRRPENRENRLPLGKRKDRIPSGDAKLPEASHRDLGEIGCERVLVDAIEAALGDLATRVQ